MNILKWEKLINLKYKVKKVEDINQLKPYLTSPKMYQNLFTVFDITETEIDDSNFYAAYVFDENQIVNRNVISKDNSGWNTTVLFIESKDKKNITNWFIHQSNGLYPEEMDLFLTDIKMI